MLCCVKDAILWILSIHQHTLTCCTQQLRFTLIIISGVVYLVYWWNSDYLCDSLKRSAHITGWFGLSIWGLRSVIWRAQVKEIKFTFLVFFDLCTYGFDECMRVYFHLSWRVCLQAGYIQLGQVIWPKQMHKRCLFHTWKVLLLFNKTA